VCEIGTILLSLDTRYSRPKNRQIPQGFSVVEIKSRGTALYSGYRVTMTSALHIKQGFPQGFCADGLFFVQNGVLRSYFRNRGILSLKGVFCASAIKVGLGYGRTKPD
jgi:hypothetical protein